MDLNLIPTEMRADRMAQHERKVREVRQDAALIIQRRTDEALEIVRDLDNAVLQPRLWNPIYYAAKLWHLWGYVDGLIYGMTDKLLSPNESSDLREQWRKSCDHNFGEKIGKILGFNEQAPALPRLSEQLRLESESTTAGTVWSVKMGTLDVPCASAEHAIMLLQEIVDAIGKARGGPKITGTIKVI